MTVTIQNGTDLVIGTDASGTWLRVVPPRPPTTGAAGAAARAYDFGCRNAEAVAEIDLGCHQAGPAVPLFEPKGETGPEASCSKAFLRCDLPAGHPGRHEDHRLKRHFSGIVSGPLK